MTVIDDSGDADDRWTEAATEDGSPTFVSARFREASHHRVGAVTEALGKFTAPAGARLAAAPKDEVRILDACFGAGTNTWALLERGLPPGCRARVTGVEINSAVLAFAPRFARWFPGQAGRMDAVAAGRSGEDPRVLVDDLAALAVPGSALGAAVAAGGPYDLIFHDAFSPPRCPELWTVELFTAYRRLIGEDGALLTYSSARAVMAGLHEAGWDLRWTAPVGRRTGGLLALPRRPGAPADHAEGFAVDAVPWRAAWAGDATGDLRREALRLGRARAIADKAAEAEARAAHIRISAGTARDRPAG